MLASRVALRNLSTEMAAARSYSSYTTLSVTTPSEGVMHVELNNPPVNAMNTAFWEEIRDCFHNVKYDSDVRAVVLSASGRMFSAGLDLKDATGLLSGEDADPARKAFAFRQKVAPMQESFTAIANTYQPVIAAIHGACIGGAIDLISAADIRVASEDAWFSIAEVDIGLAADIGTLQRFPKVVGNDSIARELAFTGRKFDAYEAVSIGLLSRVCEDKAACVENALEIATEIASKSPVAVAGTKESMNYSRDHTTAEGLEHILNWNAAMIQTEDVMKAVMAKMQKAKATFSRL